MADTPRTRQGACPIMTIIVCIKQVPASDEVRIDPVSGNLIRDFDDGIMNPFDRNAVEAALRLKERTGAKVAALSMGPRQFADTLREALAMGCDEAVLLSSKAFAGADTLATGYTLSRGIEKIGGAQLVLFGRHAIDADSGQVGPIVAEFLGLPHASYACGLQLEADGERLETGGHLLVTRLLDRSEETVRLRLPAVLTVAGELNVPRYAAAPAIMWAATADITVYDERDLGCDPARIGGNGSPTVVTRVFAPVPPDGAVRMLSGDSDAAAAEIVGLLERNSLL